MCALADLPALFDRSRAGLATANIGLITDIIACPGMDYCALATARSIPVAQDRRTLRTS
jgi:sulfite reductase (NADPH) hemoprotein beta-component